jgi:indolepyruvate ferredoxin oxidoreductase beta subunit
VFGLYAVPGGLDVLVGSELLEAARQATNGLVSPDRTTVLVSSARSLTTTEKMHMADGRVPDEALLAVLRSTARELEVTDMAALAAQGGTVISAVMLGALAGWGQASGRLPFARSAYEAAITRGGKGVQASLRGFGLAYERLLATNQQRAAVLAVAEPVLQQSAAPLATVTDLPAPVAAIAALGHARLLDYQDQAYATQYLQRLRAVVAQDTSAGFEASAQTARWLALWMAFDDIVRVADLKCRASRWQRVQREVAAQDGDVLRIYDHFKPGVPEIAALLPTRWAQRLLAWDQRRQARGLEPWALPVALASHSLTGLLALRLLASAKGQRRRGSRFATEQQLIERWLAGITQGLKTDPALGLEIARCGQLIKGYGSTNERGKHHLLHVLEHLAPQGSASAVAAVRRAALADDSGQQLDQALVAHGAPPRPLQDQPIRWMPRPRKPAN